MAYNDLQALGSVTKLPTPSQLENITDERLKEKVLEKAAPSTGYPELDLLVKGFIPGHLYTLTGDTNVGKTSVACNFTVRVALQHRKVLYFALEPGLTVIDYLASIFHKKTFDSLDPDDFILPLNTIHVLTKEQVANINVLVDFIESSERYDLVVIDHIGYFITSEHSPIQEQSNVVKKLALLAKRKACAILLIAHLRKRSVSRRSTTMPTADDISGSAAFKQDSTEVFIVTRMPKTDEKDEVELATFGKLYVLKTKAGPNGAINLNFSERSALIYSDGEVLP